MTVAALARRPALVAAAFLLLVGLAPAATGDPRPILPDELRWASPPNNPSVQGAWVVGGEQQPGPYLFRVKLAAGGRIPPHTHPDLRSSTVLAGTLYVGFGTAFDEAAVVVVSSGAVYVAPAGVAHYVWAKDGAVVYQESGTGPTATVPATH